MYTTSNPCEVVQAIVDRGGHGTSGYLTVYSSGSVVLEFSYGHAFTSAPCSVDTPFNMWCGTKPMVALAVLGIAEELNLDLDTHVSAWIQPPIGFALPPTLRQVLNHSGGLARPNSTDVRTASRSRRTSMAFGASSSAGRRQYSEYVGWWTLGECIRAWTGLVPEFVVNERVCRALGLDNTWFMMTEIELADRAPTIGCYAECSQPTAIPLLHDRLPSVACDLLVGSGGFSSTRDLGKFYDAINQSRTGRSELPRGLPSSEALSRALDSSDCTLYDDDLLGFPCSFSAGFLSSISSYTGSDSPSRQSIGHFGWLGSSLAFADPIHNLAVAAFFNGGSFVDAAHHEWRKAIVDSVYSSFTNSGRS